MGFAGSPAAESGTLVSDEGSEEDCLWVPGVVMMNQQISIDMHVYYT